MRSKIIIATAELKEGEYLECVFDNYVEMVKNSVDWAIFCIYQLKPNSLKGVLRILELPNLQIARTNTAGALMYDFIVPEDRINFAILDSVSGKACVDHMKLQTGMIGVMDDHRIYNYMYNGGMKIFDVSLKKGANSQLRDRLAQSQDKYYIDTDRKIALLMESIIDTYGDKAPLSTAVSAQIEMRITEAMMQLTGQQDAKKPRFTQSEKAALAVRKQVFAHMDGNLTTESLAKTHGISQRSLQNGFKSLFGFTPNQFIRLLKLNLVHHDLIQSAPSQLSVSRLAQKWGFTHMGRFSNYYRMLFSEPPSASLKRTNPMPSGIHIDCTARKEEL